jgi:hypothetical protein
VAVFVKPRFPRATLPNRKVGSPKWPLQLQFGIGDMQICSVYVALYINARQNQLNAICTVQVTLCGIALQQW